MFSFSIAQDGNPLKPIATSIHQAYDNDYVFEHKIGFEKSSQISNPKSGINRWIQTTLNESEIRSLVANTSSHISLSIPYLNQKNIVLDLIQSDLYADGFTVNSPQGILNYKPGIYYRGIIKGDDESIAAISVFDNEIYGMISTNAGNIVIQSSEENKSIVNIYNDNDITIANPMNCDTKDEENGEDWGSYQEGFMTAGDCVKVYIECDYALYQNKGGTSQTVNWISAVYNNVATLYANESINTTISEVFVWTTQDNYSKTSSSTALSQFRTARPSFNGNLAHLAALGGNNIGGVAYLDVLCSNYNYAYSNISSTYNSVPTYSWTVMVMTHEMGHNLGSNHTQWCGWSGGALDNCYTTEGGCAPGPPPTNGGTIMSYCHLTNYGINFNNGFGSQPGNKIRSEVAAATCLSNSCSSCPTPTGLNASNITNNSALISWNAANGAINYKLDYKLSSATVWNSVTVSGTSYTLTGLQAGSTYNARVQTNCSGGSSSFSGTISFTTTGGSCSAPSNLAISDITTTSAKASWSAVSGALSYNFQYKANSSSSWQTVSVATTSYIMTGLSPSTLYNTRVQTVCSSGTSAYSAQVNFTTAASNSYCASKGTSASQEWVKRVKLNTIDRTSGNDGGYYNGTSMSTSITIGTSQTIYFQAGITGTKRNLYWCVWIDFNRNGSFDDAGERVVAGYSNSTNLLLSNFTVPTSSSAGTTRMRVSMKYGGLPTSCETFARGEVEDYTVNLVSSSGLLSENAKNTIQEINEFEMKPNPVNEVLRLRYQSASSAELKLAVFNLLGEQIKLITVKAYEGMNEMDLDCSDFNQGNYYLQIQSGISKITQKFTKI